MPWWLQFDIHFDYIKPEDWVLNSHSSAKFWSSRWLWIIFQGYSLTGTCSAWSQGPWIFRELLLNMYCYLKEVQWMKLWDLPLYRKIFLKVQRVESFWPLSQSRKRRLAPWALFILSLSVILSCWPFCLLLYKRNDLNLSP